MAKQCQRQQPVLFRTLGALFTYRLRRRRQPETIAVLLAVALSSRVPIVDSPRVWIRFV